MIADGAEPKSCADYRAAGLPCRAARKGPGSLRESMKWLQSLAEIVIDPARCPRHRPRVWRVRICKRCTYRRGFGRIPRCGEPSYRCGEVCGGKCLAETRDVNFWLVAGRLSAFCRRAGPRDMRHKYKNGKRSDKMQTYLDRVWKERLFVGEDAWGGAGVDGLILRRFPQRRGRQCAAGCADRIETMQNGFCRV